MQNGYVEELVGRHLSNLATGNAPNSFFGVDLGVTRRLLLTCYSLRNRPSFATQSLLCWNFEGSNDMIHWTVID